MLTNELTEIYLRRAKEIQEKLHDIRDDDSDGRGGRTFISSRLRGRIRAVNHECYSELVNLTQTIFTEASPQFRHLKEMRPASWPDLDDGEFRDSLV